MRYLYVLLVAALLLGTQTPATPVLAGTPGITVTGAASIIDASPQAQSAYGSPVIDGDKDDIYGDPISADPLADIDQPNLDLTGLYLLEDADNYYIGLDALASDWGMTYGIYLDTDQVDGSGATTDPWGRAVNAVSAHRPEYTLYVWHDGADTLGDAQLNHWNGSAWDFPTLVSLGGAQAYSPSNNFIEYKIPKTALGNPAAIAIEAFTTGGGGHAQDTVPSDPNVAYASPDWGGATTTLSSFLVFPPVIDGALDAAYGAPVSTDPQNDINEPNLDLYRLYITDDAENYYIAFDAFASTWGMTYGIYIDTDQVDSSGSTSDPWGRAVNAVPANRPEFALYAYHQGTDVLDGAQLTTWNGSSWDYPTLASVGGAQAYNAANDLIEYKVPKAALGNPDAIAVEVFTTGSGGHAQDTIPSDPNVAYASPDWGADTTTLSSFLVFPPQIQSLTLTVSSPTQNQVFAGANINVTGNVDPATGVTVSVEVNGDTPLTPTVDGNGDFSQPITLNLGANTITVTADDGVTTKQVVRNVTYGVSNDNNVLFSALGHNSRDTLYRNPGGAVSTGTAVTLRLRAASGDLQEARVRVWNDRLNTSAMYDMTRVATGVALPNDPGPYEFWEATLPASADPTVYWYRFVVKDGTKTAYYADDDARTGGWGEATADVVDNGYQLSIYDAAFTTPDWVKNAVIYQIFPDRFNDGNSANNPAAGEFFYGNNDTIFRSNGTEWNTVICDPRDRPGAVASCADKYSNNFYGGDLQGITDQIDNNYFSNLGVTVLYLNPIFKSPSNHKYDTTDYGQIDPHFGTLADFEAMVDAANAKNIHIVLDGVFNHVSSDSPYLDRYSRYPEVGACESETSPYRDWFYFTEADPAGSGACVGDDGTPGGSNYESWWGYDSLPKLRANDAAVRQLIWDSTPGSPTAGIARYWIDQGASGWRLDVGGDVDPGTINDPTNDYWEGFRNAVHDSNPEGYIVGEEWGNAISWNLGGEWDSTMNYQQSAAILSFWRDEAFTDNDFNTGSSAGALNPITAEALNERLLNLKERYPAEAFAAMLNLFGSHDTNRPLFLLNHDADQNDTSLYANPNYDWSDSIVRLKGAALLQMTLPGAPTIYYGDEVGLVGPPSYDGSRWQDDPYNRQPYPWLGTGLGDPYYAHLQDDTAGSARAKLLAYYQTLTATRNGTPALRTGSLDPLYAETDSPVYIYGRKMADDSSAAIIAVNKSGTDEDVTINVAGYLPGGAVLSDALSPATFTVEPDGDLVLTGIPAQGGYLLVLDAGFAGDRPAAPNLASAVATTGKVTLTWDAVSGADSYDIYRSLLSGGAYELIGNTAAITYEDTAVTNGVKYYYVVKAKTTSLLASDFSNELSGLPAYVIDWANLQSPPTISADRSLVTPSVAIYGRVYIAGVSGGQNAEDPTPSLIAQVGYGDDTTLPTHASWRWYDTTFNINVGNNDEFVGNLVLDAPAGSYDYLYRYSTDGGLTWVYGAYNNTFYATLGSYDPANAGQLTITAPSDTTAPDAPTNLTLTGTTTDSISMAWDAHPDTDGDLYGFEIWRKDTTASEPGFTRVDLLADPTANSYTDTTVAANHDYEYYITAVDESVNASAASNTISATAEMRMVAVTFNVTVPDPTPGVVYLAGNLGPDYPNWNPGGVTMTNVGGGVWQVTLNLLDGSEIEYKYARGVWEKVEKQADGNTEVNNRPLTVAYGGSGTQTVNDTVESWRDPIVAVVSPADGATNVAVNSTIVAAWSKGMADPIDPAGCFAVTGPGGAVSGSATYNSGTYQYTFTPDTDLASGTHTVTLSGCKDASSNVQQVTKTWSFDVVSTPPSVVSITRANSSPTAKASVNFTVTFSEPVSGVDVSDFTLVKTGQITGHAITGVTPASGPATTYTVTVNTGSKNGTLRLDVNATGTGITDADSNALTGGFTSGEIYAINKRLTMYSVGANDGHVRETSEFSNVGGPLDSTSTTFFLGDDTSDNQYRGFLSFNTANIPAGAVITQVIVRVKMMGVTGTNPLNTHGSLLVDLRKGIFGPSKLVESMDFQSPASFTVAGIVNKTALSGNVYQALLKNLSFAHINRAGLTQVRLRFTLDDNNDLGNDILKLFSGNHATQAYRPQLIIEYYIP